MQWSDADHPDGEPATLPTAQSGALFLNDRGSLPRETREVLVKLLAGPSVDQHHHSKLWQVLVRDEKVVRRFLAELFLELVMDNQSQVAFARQADTGDLDAPLLLRRSKLTFLDSVLLLFLRQRLTQSEAQGERAVVSVAEMQDQLTMYSRADSTDHAGFGKRAGASIEKIKANSILHKIRGSEDRYEISPTLKLLFSAEEISALTKVYRRMADGEPAAQDVSEARDEGSAS